MLHLHYGREGLDKNKYIFDRIKEAPGRTLLIVPDQYTLQAERDAFFYLQTRGLMTVDIIGMSGLGGKILKETGGGRRTFISKTGRHMLLADILAEYGGSLGAYKSCRDSNAFIEMVNNFISTLKQYGISPDALAGAAEEGGPGVLHGKLADIAGIYRQYEQRISGKYTDTEDYVNLYAGKIPGSAMIRESVIWIHGFDTMTPKHQMVMGSLVKTAKQVNLVVTLDQGGKDASLFDITSNLVRRLEPREISQIGDEYLIPKAPGLVQLERQLFAMPVSPSTDFEGLKLTAAANIYAEAESAAVQVLHLVRDLGLRYKDILMICNDLDTRGQIYRRVFGEYGMDLFLDTKRSVSHHPLTGYVQALLDVITRKYRAEDVLRFAKTGLASVSDDEISDFETYIRLYKIRGSAFKKPFTKGETNRGLGRNEEERKQELERLNGIRKGLTGPLGHFERRINKAAAIRQKCEVLYEFLKDKADFSGSIGRLLAEQQASGQLEHAQETAQLWNILMGLLDQMAEISGERIISTEGFADLLGAGIASVELGMIPPAQDGLILGTMQRTRSSGVKAMLVLGANEGILPADDPGDDLLTRDEMEKLAGMGLEIGEIHRRRIKEENLSIYRNLSKPTQSLWISYATSNEKGEAARPSVIVERIRQVFPDLPVEPDVLTCGNAADLVQSPASTLRHLTKAMQDEKKGRPLAEIWQGARDWYAANQPEALQRIEVGLDDRNDPGRMTAETAAELYRPYGGGLVLSPSRLERFGRCPFSHFIRYGIRPLEPRVYEVGPIEQGELYHRCLMEVSEALGRQGPMKDAGSLWKSAGREDISRLVSQCMDRIRGDFGEGILGDSGEGRYRSLRMQEILEEASWNMVEHVRKGQIMAMDFEQGFGRDGVLPPIRIPMDKEEIVIEGKIDRMDLLPGDLVKIIDYKSGQDSFSMSEARSGWKLQLMVYLKAATESRMAPAGVFYFHIREPWVDAASIKGGAAGEAFRQKLAEEVRKCFRMDGLMVDEPEIIEAVSGGDTAVVPSGKTLCSREAFNAFLSQVNDRVGELCRELAGGNIDIAPMKIKDETACKFCDYKGICMFDIRLEGCYYVLA